MIDPVCEFGAVVPESITPMPVGSLAAMSIDSGPWRRSANASSRLERTGASAPIDLRRDVGAGHRTGAINLGQGFPTRTVPRRCSRRRAGHLRRCEPVPAGTRDPGAPRRLPAHQQRFYGLTSTPTGGARHRRGDGGSGGQPSSRSPSRATTCVTFEPFYDAYGAIAVWPGATPRDRAAAVAGLPAGSRRSSAPRSPTAPESSSSTTRTTPPARSSTSRRCSGSRAVPSHDAVDRDRRGLRAPDLRRSPRPHRHAPRGRERTLTISSGGKTFSTTGWKIGWLIAPRPLVATPC